MRILKFTYYLLLFSLFNSNHANEERYKERISKEHLQNLLNI